jgi:DNA-binding response OmpR family regulator
MSLDGLRVPSVVVVEDNETLRDELVLYLSEEGFSVRGVGSGQELNDAMEALPTDILILDLNLPEEDGISITRRIRRSLPTVGIIMLTARLRSTDRLEGYASGADVYLTKPTRPEELVAVVQNLFSRLGVRVDPAPWEIDMAGSMLHSPKGLQIELTANEARLLMALTVNGQFLDHAALLSRFGGEAQSEKINKSRLEVLISRLRTKLGPHISHGFDIRAVRGQGYQLGFVLVVKNMALGK